MTELKNRKHEAFARALFEGLASDNPAWKAYIKAGYTGHEPSARADSSRLLKSAPEIIERVREFQREAAKQTGETVEKVTGELNGILQDAREDRAHNAAVSAIGLKSKILGLVVDRQETGPPGSFGDYSQVKNKDDWARKYLTDHMRARADHTPEHRRSPPVAPEAITDDQIKATLAETFRHLNALSAIAPQPTKAKC